MAKMPYFAVGESTNLQRAIDLGVLSYPAFVFISDKNMLAFIGEENDVRYVNGNNKMQVLYVNTLPAISNGERDVLYIKNGTVYAFNGEKYIAQFVDHTEKFNEIDREISSLDNNKVDKVTGMGLSHNDLTNVLVAKINEIDNKVTKVTGKDLSDNNLTNELLAKINSALQYYTETDPTVPAHVKKISITDITTWNAKSDFSGSYNDLTNKPNAVLKINGIAPRNGEFTLNYDNINNVPKIPEAYNDAEIRSLISNKQDKGNYALKTEIPSLNGYATEGYVDGKVSDLINSAPSTLDTLKELSDALGNDPNFATTIAAEIGKKADKEYVDKQLENVNIGDISYNDLIDKPTIPEAYNDAEIRGKIEKIITDSFHTTEDTKFIISDEIVELADKNDFKAFEEKIIKDMQARIYELASLIPAKGEVNVDNELVLYNVNDVELFTLSLELPEVFSSPEKWQHRGKYLFDYVENYYVGATGTLIAYNGWRMTPMLNCEGALYLVVNSKGDSGGYNAFYDKDEKFISNFSYGSGIDAKIMIPENAAYVRLSCGSTYNYITPFAK